MMMPRQRVEAVLDRRLPDCAPVCLHNLLLGNIDSSGVLAHGSVDDVGRATRELMAVWKEGGGFMLNAGCAISPTTPSVNVHALMGAAWKHGSYSA